MLNCLVVDDDFEIRESLQDYLQSFGMRVEAAIDGPSLRRLLPTRRFDVIVLDLMLPGEDGLSLCRWVQQEYGTPVIMLTAQGDPISRVLGLEMGADDYLAKPFEPRELVARINAVTRRTGRSSRGSRGAENARSVSFGGWRFDLLARQLFSPDQVMMPLSSAEFRLLSAFVEHPGRVLSREQLIELTRAPGVEVNDRSIDLAVSRLRQKLSAAQDGEQLICTIRGEGYIFDAEVR